MTRPGLFLLIPLAFSVGCTSEDSGTTTGAGPNLPAPPTEDTAEATVKYIIEGLSNGQPVVLWSSLPEKYQNDINGLVQTFGTSMDPKVWEQVTGLLTKMHTVLTEKKDFILNHPMVAAQQKDPAEAEKSIAGAAGLLKTVLDTFGNLDNLKTFDGGKFLSGPGAQFADQITKLQEMSPMPDSSGVNNLKSLKDVKVETVSSTDAAATLKITNPDGKTEEVEFVKTEGKWLPKDMVDDWDKNLAEAKAGLAELPAKSQEMQMQVGMMTAMVGGVLDQLANAESQESFNQAIEGIMGLMGGGPPGGGGFGPPGGSEGEPDGSLNDFGDPESQNDTGDK